MSLSIEIIFWITAGLIGYGYVFYALILAGFYWALPPRAPVFTTALPRVSIVIAAYNEEQAIEARIENCLNLDYPKDKIEIIIASDGSTDRTNEIVSAFSQEQVRLICLKQRQGKVNAINHAVPSATNQILIFSDATSHFKSDLARKLVRHFGDTKVGCVCGNVVFTNAAGSKTGELEGAYWKLETYLRQREGERGSTLGATGAAFAMRRDLWRPCPSNALVEDLVMPMKVLQMGHHVNFEPEAIATETAAEKIDEEFERRRRIGAGALQSLILLLPMLNPFRGFPAIAFFSHKVIRWLTPILMIACLLSHVALATSSGLYLGLLIPHVAFYLAAFVGLLVGRNNRVYRILSLPYYFVSMNTALFCGYVKYLRGTQKVTWNRVNR